MTHLWLRAEERANERRTPLTPEGAQILIASGFKVTVEDSIDRCISTQAFSDSGCNIVEKGTWRKAPADAIILGLKELPDDGTSLPHTHIMFGHAFKGQPDGPALLRRFKDGGGTLLDLEYLTEDSGRRLVAFGYWAGFAGAAVSLLAWAAQQTGKVCPAVSVYDSEAAIADHVRHALGGATPTAIVIGALGRVGTGARDMCTRVGVPTTDWDIAETSNGGPFPEVLDHNILLNCILAGPGCPVFFPKEFVALTRKLGVIGDIACDPGSDYNPVPIYDRATTWAEPVIRVAENPMLDVMAIDNLPSLLPAESSSDFAGQLLPLLETLKNVNDPVWTRARKIFHQKSSELE